MSQNGGARRREATERQAAEYVLALSHDPAPALLQQVDDWLAAAPEHAVAFAQAERAWETAAYLGGLKLSVPPAQLPGDDGADAAGDHPALSGTGSSRRRFLGLGAIAASMAAGMAGMAWLGDDRQTYRTAIGEMRDVALADGSHLHLNTDTCVTVALSATRRSLVLERGEAFFDVAHDPAAPLEVAAGDAVFRALGTAFNIRLSPARVELTVTDGVVGVLSAAGASNEVRAGKAARVARSAIALTTLAPDMIEQRTAWRNGIVELNGQTLTEAVAEMNRYRSAPIIVGDQRIAALRMGGRFHPDRSDAFLAALRQTLPVGTVTREDGSVLLVYRPREPVDTGPAVIDSLGGTPGG